MKIVLSILAILFLFANCQTSSNNTIEGDLYFKLVDAFPIVVDASYSELKEFERYKMGIRNVNADTLPKGEKETIETLQAMSHQKLLGKPYIRLRLDNGENVMVFLDQNDFRKLKHYNYTDLVEEKKKIRIKAEVSTLKINSMTAYKAKELVSIDKIDGKTYWKK